MRYLFLVLLTIMNHPVSAQSDFDTSRDVQNQSVVFKGFFTFDDLIHEPSFTWLKEGSDLYQPDSAAIGYLRQHLDSYEIVVAMGTWCDDSKNLVPKLYKVLQSIQFPWKQYTMFGVDRAKESKGKTHTQYQITLVPTIILFKAGKEIGRITESVQESVEADLATIIRNSEH